MSFPAGSPRAIYHSDSGFAHCGVSRDRPARSSGVMALDLDLESPTSSESHTLRELGWWDVIPMGSTEDFGS